MGRKKSKYSRRSAATVHRSKKAWTIVVIVVAVLASAGLAVLCGNLLGARIDALEREGGDHIEAITPSEEIELDHEIPDARAHYFEYASKVTSYMTRDIYSFSLCLRDAQGYVPYASAVAEIYGEGGMGQADLKTKVSDIHEYSGKAYGYFYSTCFSESDANIRRVKRAYELSLIAEAAQAGVDDILLLGISVNVGNISEVLEFVDEIKRTVGERVDVGIATDSATLLSTQSNVYTAGKLLNGCDYLALDLRGFVYAEATEGETSKPQYDPSTGGVMAHDVTELLSLMKYYISSYSLRVLFDADDSAGLETYRELGYRSYQTVKDKYGSVVE